MKQGYGIGVTLLLGAVVEAIYFRQRQTHDGPLKSGFALLSYPYYLSDA